MQCTKFHYMKTASNLACYISLISRLSSSGTSSICLQNTIRSKPRLANSLTTYGLTTYCTTQNCFIKSLDQITSSNHYITPSNYSIKKLHETEDASQVIASSNIFIKSLPKSTFKNRCIKSLHQITSSDHFTESLHQTTSSNHFIKSLHQITSSNRFIKPLYQITSSNPFIKSPHQIATSYHFIKPLHYIKSSDLLEFSSYKVEQTWELPCSMTALKPSWNLAGVEPGNQGGPSSQDLGRVLVLIQMHSFVRGSGTK